LGGVQNCGYPIGKFQFPIGNRFIKNFPIGNRFTKNFPIGKTENLKRFPIGKFQFPIGKTVLQKTFQLEIFGIQLESF
jgi:hypothetical protein